MVFEKHMRKYYLRYIFLYILGIASLVAVDYAQTFIPEYLGSIVNVIDNNTKGVITFDDALIKVTEIAIYILIIAVHYRQPLILVLRTFSIYMLLF